jgi:hypothetical protein
MVLSPWQHTPSKVLTVQFAGIVVMIATVQKFFCTRFLANCNTTICQNFHRVGMKWLKNHSRVDITPTFTETVIVQTTKASLLRTLDAAGLRPCMASKVH